MSALTLDDRGVVVSCPQCQQKNRLTYERLGAEVRCATCKAVLSQPDEPIEVPTSASFDALIARATVPVIVDYWAPWCGPCRMVAPELKKVATHQAGRFLVAKVNTDELSDLGDRFSIRSIPTMAIFAGGREIARTAGARPARDIEAFAEQAAAKARTSA